MAVRESLKLDFEAQTQYYDREETPFVRILLVGESGSGKTYLSGTFPAPYFLDCDKGMATLAGSKVPYFSIEYGQEASRILMLFLARVYQQEVPFDKTETLVIDSFSALSNLLEVELAQFPREGTSEVQEVMSLPGFRYHRRRMLNILNMLMKLSSKMNVIATANIETDKDEVFGRIIEVPSVAGRKLPVELPRYFDEVWKCSYDPKEEQWIIETRPTRFFGMAKTRRGLPAVVKDPSYEKLKKYFIGENSLAQVT